MERNWEARFEDPRPLSLRTKVIVVGGHFGAVTVASFAMWRAGWLVGEGGSILILFLTLPASGFLMNAVDLFRLAGPISDLVNPTLVAFVLFFVCCILNALLLYGVLSLVRVGQNRSFKN